MANEIMFSHTPASGLTYDVLMFNAAGEVDAGSIQGFGAYSSINYGNYISLRTVTELGDSGVYVSSMEESGQIDAGYYRWVVKRRASVGAPAAETDRVVWQDGPHYWDGTAFVAGAAASDPLLASVPGGYAQGTAGWALGRIGTGQIVTVSVVAQGGRVTLVRGDSYTASLGRAIDFVDASAAWPVLTGASVYFRVDDGVLERQGLVVTATGASKQVRVELSGSDTSLFDAGTYDYTVVAVYSSDEAGTGTDGEVTLATGKCEFIDEEGS